MCILQNCRLTGLIIVSSSLEKFLNIFFPVFSEQFPVVKKSFSLKILRRDNRRDNAPVRKLDNEKLVSIKLHSDQIGNKSITRCKMFDISWHAIHFSKIIDAIFLLAHSTLCFPGIPGPRFRQFNLPNRLQLPLETWCRGSYYPIIMSFPQIR